jgi:pyruvate/2-oxoglutarate dehydrogenase complex dihydrolipoamide acyltransferase (E2) component
MAFDPLQVSEQDIFRFMALTKRQPTDPDQAMTADVGQGAAQSRVLAILAGAANDAAAAQAAGNHLLARAAELEAAIVGVEQAIERAKAHAAGIEGWFGDPANRNFAPGDVTELRDGIMALAVLRKHGQFRARLRRAARALRFVTLCDQFRPQTFYVPTGLALEKLIAQIPIKFPNGIIRRDPDPLAVRVPDGVEGVVKTVHVAVDDAVANGAPLITIDVAGVDQVIPATRDAVVKQILVHPELKVRGGAIVMRLGVAPAAPAPGGNLAGKQNAPKSPKPAELRTLLESMEKVLGNAIDAQPTKPSGKLKQKQSGVFGRAVTWLFGKRGGTSTIKKEFKPTKVADFKGLTGQDQKLLGELKLTGASMATAHAAVSAKLSGQTKVNAKAAAPTHFFIAGTAIPNIQKQFGHKYKPDDKKDDEPADKALVPGMPVPARVEPIMHAGEIMVVRKRLIGYELGEFSYVENVFAGETRARSHRKRRLTEEEVRRLTIVEEQTEQHLQQTQRDELQSEMERVAQTEMQAEAGVKIQGKYGPTTEFQAEASAGIRSSVQTSTRSAANHVRETVSRSVEKVTRRKEEELRRRIVTEIEETNSHEFKNSGGAHLRGAYRWLGKVYQAQVYNIGFRHSVEFLIPEPAMNFLELIAQGRVKAGKLPRKPDTIPIGPDSADWDSDWGDLAVEYEATVPPPPRQFETVVTQTHATPGEMFAYSTSLTIPDGYEAKFGRVKGSKSQTEEDDWWLHAWLGSRYFECEDGGNTAWNDGANLYENRSQIAFAVLGRFLRGVAISAEVNCRVTDERMKEWRAEAFNAVMQGYQTQLARWEEKMAEINEQAESERERELDLPNPAVVEQMIRVELQRLFLAMLLNNNFKGFDAFVPSADKDDPSWKYDWKKAAAVIPQIMFLHQSFEFHNMNAVFYPYYYGRRARWATSMQTTKNSDPALAEFLTAGAVRVQVPIRPEAADLMLRFIDLKRWPNDSAQDGQVLGDAQGVPILTEMLESMDHPDEAIPIGPSWEFTLPTDLVILQDTDDFAFRDPLRPAGANPTTIELNSMDAIVA